MNHRQKKQALAAWQCDRAFLKNGENDGEKLLDILPKAIRLKIGFKASIYMLLVYPLFFAALLLWTPLLLAQAFDVRNLEFERLTIDDGLSQNFVACIAQDHQGFLWFGTRDGLNRYDGYHFKVYSHNAIDSTSLSANDIRAIYEDRQGNLWIGTFAGGLNRYDRANDRFIRYQHDPKNPHSLSHNHVQVILEDSRHGGTLWIGTTGGLNRFDPNTQRFTRYFCQPDDTTSRGHNDISAIFQDQTGSLWLGLNHPSSGLLFFDRSTESFTAFEVDPAHPNQNNSISTFYADARGDLWAGAFSGLFRMKTAARQPNYVRPNSENLRLSEPGRILKVADYPGDISAICQDDAGRLWLGSSSFGLFIYDMGKGEISEVRYDPLNYPHSGGITTIFRDRSDLIWLGTNGSGLRKLNRAHERFGRLVHDPKQTNSLGVTSIRSICEDKDDNLWIGGYGGLDHLDRKTGRFTHYQLQNRQATGFGGEIVWAIYEDPLLAGDQLWLGTEGDGLYRFDRKSKKFFQYKNASGSALSVNSNFVFSIYRDKSGTLWVGTDAGLHRFDELSETFKQYNYSAEDTSGLSGAPFSGRKALSGGLVLSICESDFGDRRVLWLATENGLVCFDPATEQFAQFLYDPHNPNSFSNSNVHCVHQDRSGRLWIGTSGGLSRLVLLKANDGHLPLPEDVGFVHYTEIDGLPNHFINGILEDEQGNLWLSTNKGISRFSPETKTFRNYDVRDGLQSMEFNRSAYYRCRHGEMFFGGIAGLNYFFPESFKDNPHRPAVVITGFNIFNESVDIGKGEDWPLKKQITVADEIRLSYEDHVFSFEFAALEYTAQEKNQYAYKMEGFDKDWVHVRTKRTVTYTNLDPGEYTFRVKASNNDGVWNEEGVALNLVIAPPWRKTWWFRILATTLLGILLYSAYRGRVRSLEARKHELETKVQERTHELTEALRRLKAAQQELILSEKMAALGHLIAGVAHEINTPLGAVNSSNTNISQALEKTLKQWPKLYSILTPARQADFLALLEKARDHETILTAGEKRQARTALQQQLQAAQIAKAETIADTLVDIGIDEGMERFYPLLREPCVDLILDTIYNLARLQINNRNIATAVGRASKVVFALKNYIHFNHSGEKKLAEVVEEIETVLTLYQNQLKHGVEVRRDYEETPPVACYPDELTQVWTNIIHNALQAMDFKGTLEITVRKRSTTQINATFFDRPRSFLVVSITDSGVGIPHEHLPRIFEPFFTTKPAGEGSGLGLDISKKIIDKHGGFITVASQPGRTTFEVWLPAE